MSSLFSKIAGIFGKSEPKEESSQHTAPEATTANDAVKAEPLTASDNIDDTDDVNIENSGDSENIDNLDITEPALLIRISRAYDTNMTEQELYDITRSSWKVNYDRVKNVEYAFSIYQGQILEVYKVAGWYGAGTTFAERNEDALASGRFEFVGSIAEDAIRNKYLDKSVQHFFKPGNAQPIMYLNC